jgi:pyruvate kinase
MQSQTNFASGGPELRGSNITLEKVMKKTDTSNRQTKIICTLGPACWDVPMLENLIDEGLSVARFNFSHGDHEGHKSCLDRLREAASNKKKNVGKDDFAMFLDFAFFRLQFEKYLPTFSHHIS